MELTMHDKNLSHFTGGTLWKQENNSFSLYISLLSGQTSKQTGILIYDNIFLTPWRLQSLLIQVNYVEPRFPKNVSSGNKKLEHLLQNRQISYFTMRRKLP